MTMSYFHHSSFFFLFPCLANGWAAMVYLFCLGFTDVGINLGSGQTGVSEQFLHHPQVGPAVEQMCGKGVADGMGVHFFIDAALFGILLHDFLDTPFNQTAVRNG